MRFNVVRAAVSDEVAARAIRYRDVVFVESYLAALGDGHLDEAGRVLEELQCHLGSDPTQLHRLRLPDIGWHTS